MIALSLKIRLLEPLLAVEVGGGDPNSAKTLSYIPGSTLRGAVIERYLNNYPVSDLAGDLPARRLFFDGSVCYLNAYPLIPTGQRMLPAPLSWYVEKDTDGNEIYDFAIPECEKPDEPKPVELPFFYPLEGDRVFLRQPERHISIHTYRRERSGQNKNEDSVFRYEALSADQTFGAFILADDANDLELVGRLLSPPDLSIGGSHRAGYGRVQLEVESLEWPGEYPAVDEAETGSIIVTCLSDILVRSEVSSEAGVYANHLSSILGINHAQAFTRQRLVGGFNRKWGLPLPQAQAIQAGSVFVYDYSEPLYRQLRYLEITGLGERRVEGFGRIAVNLQRNPALAKKELPFGQPQSVQLSEPGFSLAQQMSERILRAGLNADLATTLAYLSINQPQPSNAQLSRLRTLVRRVLHQGDLTREGLRPITGHLNNLKGPAAKQFERARIEGKPLRSWLLQLVEKPQIVWDILRAGDKKGPAIGQAQARLTEALACEYTLRLINGLLQQAGKGDNDE